MSQSWILQMNRYKVAKVTAKYFLYQDIADWLAQICNYVGPNLEPMCLEFINEYTDDIIDQLVNNYMAGSYLTLKIKIAQMIKFNCGCKVLFIFSVHHFLIIPI